MADVDYPPVQRTDETFEDFGKRWRSYLDELALGQFRRGVTTGQTREQHARAFRIRNAAQAIQAAAKWIGDIPSAPWLVRQKLGKQGKLYTLGDIQNNVIRNNKAVNDAKAKAAREEIRRQNKTTREQRTILGSIFGDWGRRTPGIAGPLTRRSGIEPGNPVAEALTDAWLRRVLDADAARKRLSTSTNRRGALATRNLPADRSRTNRTGAAAQRPSPTNTGESSSRTARTVNTPATTRSTGQLPTSRTTVGESEASREARRVMESTRELPTATRTSTSTRSSTRSSMLTRYQPRLTGMFQRLATPTLARERTRATPTRTTSTGPSTQLELPSRLELGQRLTPMSLVGVGTQTQQAKCECPKPKKQKQKEFACSNPLVSRSVSKDGIITIRRKLQCPPSKQNAR